MRDVGDGDRPLPVRGADAVAGRVAAAQYNHVFACGIDFREVVQVRRRRLIERAGVAVQVGPRKVHACQIAPRHVQIARTQRPDAEHHRVGFGVQRIDGYVGAHFYTAGKPDALRFQQVEAAVDDGMGQLERWHATPEQTARAGIPLVHRHRVAGPVQLLRAGQPRRTGAHNRHAKIRAHIGRVGLNPSLVEGVLHDGLLDLLDSHWRSYQPGHTGRLARSRTDAPGKLGEVVGGGQLLVRRPPVARAHEHIPIGDAVAQRTARLAERHAAVHAPVRLRARLFVDHWQVHRGVVLHAFLNGTLVQVFARLVEEGFGVGHGTFLLMTSWHKGCERCG